MHCLGLFFFLCDRPAKEGVDVEVLKELMEDFADVEVHLSPYTDEETGETYESFLLMLMDYIIFE